MVRPTIQEIEARKAAKRIDVYLAGGSRLVLISRAIVAGIMIGALIVLWWRG